MELSRKNKLLIGLTAVAGINNECERSARSTDGKHGKHEHEQCKNYLPQHG